MTKSIALICLIARIACATVQSAAGAQSGPRSQTLIFVDDYSILYRSGTHRVFHPFKRYPGNPVIKDGAKPWEMDLAWNSVYRNPATGLYQIWYQAFSGNASKDRTRRSVVAYAESRDGIHFTKPNLGLFDYNGIKDTNIVLVANGGYSDRYSNSVIVDDRDPDPSRRYKMTYYDFTADRAHGYPGIFVAFSPDGIHWTKQGSVPLLRTAYGNFGTPVPFAGEPGREWSRPLSMSDAVDVMFDPRRSVFAIYGKMWIDGPDGGMFFKHAMGRTESTDFIHWSRPQIVLTPDDDDPSYVEFHTSPVFFYNDCYFGLLQILNRGEGGGIIDIQLAISRDGLHWARPFRKEFALARGARGAFDSGSIFTNSTPVILPDEIRFYYGAYSGGATGTDPHYDYTLKTGIGLATLPRDRFAGIRPDPISDQPTLLKPLANIGQVTLKPVELGPGSVLTLNADASEGSVRVELLNEHGYRVPGFSREDAVPIRGDSLRHPVAWNGHSLDQLPPGRYLVRLNLDNAEIFALTVASP